MEGMEELQTQIASAGAAVLVVGAAVLLLLVSVKVMQWVRSAITDEPVAAVDEGLAEFAAEGADLQEVDEWEFYGMERDDYFGVDTVLTCNGCGVNSVDDASLFIDSDTGEWEYGGGDECPQCGEQMVEG